jgi:hypothetical protein
MSGATEWRIVAPWPRSGQAADRTIEIAPDAEVRAELATRLGLEALSRLEARLVLRPWLDGVEITGIVEAVAERICGVSLDPYEERLQEAVELRVLPPSSPHLPGEDQAEIIIDLEAPDPPEAGDVEGVDLAAIVTESVALGLAPFARKPDAAFEAPPDDSPPSPFAVLASLAKPTRPDS